MADWDDENFEPTGIDDKVKTDKWEGEDEDDDTIKENWDDDEDGEGKKKKSEENSKESKLLAVKKKRTLKEVLKEKEEKRLEEAKLKEEMKKQMEEESEKEITPEEEIAEKLLKQRLVEDSDLLLAMDTFGTSTKDQALETNNLDSTTPKTAEEFAEYSKSLVEKFSTFQSSVLYVQFLEDTFRDICASLDADDIKRLSSTLNLLHSEKVKAQKGKTKGKGKTKKAVLAGGLKGAKNDAMDYSYQGDFGSEFDDFI